MVAGTQVYAKWVDDRFYPGHVLYPAGVPHKFTVKFEDGDIRDVQESDLIVCNLIPIGHSVLAETPDGYFDSGIVTEHYHHKTRDQYGYVIQLDNGSSKRFVKD